MKAYLANLIRDSSSALQSRNIVREYLQARILNVFQRSGGMIPLAFHGGTALRFLFSLPRHSEDLDFALEKVPSDYDFHKYLGRIESEFEKENYQIDLNVNDQKVVHSAFIRFTGLLYDLGLSTHPEEVFAIRLEVDTHPPKGAKLDTTIIRKYLTLQLQHHDQASLLAGKIHALLQRSFTKGRDLYDLIWYLSDRAWPVPNLELLNNALKQTDWDGSVLNEENWKIPLREKIRELDWTRVRSDVLPFIEDPEELNLLTRDNLLQLLS